MWVRRMSTSYIEARAGAKGEEVSLSPGMRHFLRIWSGQMISLLGSGLTQFVMEIWVYRTTHSVSQYTLLAFFNTLPGLALAPLAGVISDRMDRGKLMLYSNIAAGLTTLGVIGVGNNLRLWHVYTAVILLSICNAFLSLAYAPLVSILVPKEHYGRASGLVQSAQAAAWIVPPLVGGVLLGVLSIPAIVAMDLFTYLIAIVTLLMTRVALKEPVRESPAQAKAGMHEILEGWSYVMKRPGLQAMLIYFALINLVLGMAQVLYTPLVLSVGSVRMVGLVTAISGIAYLLGSLTMVAWGGPKKRVNGILFFGVLLGVGTVLGGSRASIPAIAASAFLMFLALPVMNGCSQAIWQSKTPIDLQGRVFAFRYMIGLSTAPLAYVLAGPLVEKVFTPLSHGLLRGILSPPSESIRLVFLISGALVLVLQAGNYLYPRFRYLENELPDMLSGAVLYEF